MLLSLRACLNTSVNKSGNDTRLSISPDVDNSWIVWGPSSARFLIVSSFSHLDQSHHQIPQNNARGLISGQRKTQLPLDKIQQFRVSPSMTSFVSWRSIVVHRFLVECTKWVSPRIHIEVFSRVKANFRLSVNFVANVRHLQNIIPQTRNEGSAFIEIMASFGCLLKKWVRVSNKLKPRDVQQHPLFVVEPQQQMMMSVHTVAYRGHTCKLNILHVN